MNRPIWANQPAPSANDRIAERWGNPEFASISPAEICGDEAAGMRRASGGEGDHPQTDVAIG